jgi:hypothetical protein
MAASVDLLDHVMGPVEGDDGHVDLGYSGWRRRGLLTGHG